MTIAPMKWSNNDKKNARTGKTSNEVVVLNISICNNSAHALMFQSDSEVASDNFDRNHFE